MFSELKNKLETAFVSNKMTEWVDININALNLISLLIVSEQFLDLSYSGRKSKVLEIIKINTPYQLGFIELYTVAEAIDEEIIRPKTVFYNKLSSWGQLSEGYKNNLKIPVEQKILGVPRVTSFYSFKGGVGRTVALAHTAYILATRGKKVAIVDMDIEAPGISYVFDPKLYTRPRFGLVDYFIDRISKGKEIERSVNITDVFSEVNFTEISGRIFVVPAGIMDSNYLGKVDNLRTSLITNGEENYWKTFLEELSAQIKPDIVLVDSRTGINSWGALSLLNVSNNIVFFAYPNSENITGLKLIINGMRQVGYANYNIVFSRIHDDKNSKKKVESLWHDCKEAFYPSDSSELDTEGVEPLSIFYNPELAVAEYYPIKSGYQIFSPIANIIDEEMEDEDLVSILSNSDRWKIIKSLSYENLGFGEDEDSSFFQKTVYVDKFLDEDVSVITGKKGTGKTKMYSMMLRYIEEVKKVSRVNLDNIISISGHGDYLARPIDEFDSWAKLVEEGKTSWESIWRSYLLVVLQKHNRVGSKRNAKYMAIKELIKPAKGYRDKWTAEFTYMVSTLATNATYTLIIQDFFSEIDQVFGKKGERLWIHYDKLDEDLERKNYGKDAIEGLFKLIQIFEGKHIKNVKFKIFIRLDIWDSLGFTNKSHFKGKTIRLEWNQQDFLKLALRTSLLSEDFTKLVGKYKPIQHIDYMDTEGLKDALQILWGIRREGSRRSQYVVNWIYERLTDADENTFPRSLFMLLKGAKEQELSYEYSANIQPPKDRLLRSAALNKGLKEASIERCDALRQEYQSLKEAFELFSSFSDTFKLEEFCSVYEKTKWKAEELLETLKKIGVISDKDNKTYKFAYIYLDGFKIKRTSKI